MSDHALPALDGSRDLTQDEWQAIREHLAEEVICAGAADQMIPGHEMRARLIRWRAADDQRLRAAEYEAGAALIALKRLGYHLTGPQ